MARIRVGQKALRGIVLGLIGTLTGGLVSPRLAEAATIELMACKKVASERDVYGSVLKTSECSGSFTPKDPYVGLVIHLQSIYDRTRVEAELLDPDQTRVWSNTVTFDPPMQSKYTDAWVWAVLPIDDVANVLRTNPQLLFHIISTKDKPFRERIGEWTLRVSMNGGGPLVLKFGLQASSE